jgi:hypothetical protein
MGFGVREARLAIAESLISSCSWLLELPAVLYDAGMPVLLLLLEPAFVPVPADEHEVVFPSGGWSLDGPPSELASAAPRGD